jgi:hypothetical protein
VRVVPLLVALLAPLAAGCAGMDEVECRRANWYDLGYRDAIFGILAQDDVYALQCEPLGVKVDSARYLQGFREGTYEADRRNAGSHD